MPWGTSPRGETFRVPVVDARRITAPISMPVTPGLAAHGVAKLRQEKTAFIQARLGAAGFAYGAIGMVTGRPAGDPQTTRTANGGVQGPPPWRRPVIT